MPQAFAPNSPADKRGQPRYPFHWPVIVRSEADSRTFTGTTHDISLDGCSVLTEDDLTVSPSCLCILALPAEAAGMDRILVRVDVRILYTVLSARHGKFRSGLQFVRFFDEDRAKLEHAIANRAKTLRA